MTNDEAAELLNGSGADVAPQGNSEPAAADVSAKEQTETVAADPKKDTVNPAETDKGAPETPKDGKKADGSKKKDFYSQERAEHAFSRQTKALNRLRAENESLKAQLEKLKGVTKDTFVDKVTGKLDEAGYLEHLADKKAAEMQTKRIESQVEEMENEQEEAVWNSRVERELGKEAKSFNDMCAEVVDDEGNTRFQKFISWLQAKDPQDVIVSRINASKNGIRLLQKMMTEKDARMSVVRAETPYKMEQALDRLEESLDTKGENQKEPEAKKTSFAESWKNRSPKETKQPEKPKPTGSAFSGEPKSAGTVHKDKDYFASLL